MKALWVALALVAATPTAVSLLPTTALYTMSDTCGWSPRPWAKFLGLRDQPLTGGDPAMHACWRRRGLKSTSPILNCVLTSWPSKAQLSAWEMADASYAEGTDREPQVLRPNR